MTKVQDANTVAVGTGIKRVVAELQKNLPADIKLRIMDDQSERVQSQLDNVKETILEGAALTMLIVFLFLHSWRSTIITGLTLPITRTKPESARQLHGMVYSTFYVMALYA